MPARDAAAAHERTLRWLCRLDRPLNRRRPARRSAAGVAAGGWRRRPVRGRRSWGLQLTPILPDTDRNDLSIVRALPLAHATDPAAGIRIAYAMNGEPLGPDHGAPFRLIVPHWYAVASREMAQAHRRGHRGRTGPSPGRPTTWDDTPSASEPPTRPETSNRTCHHGTASGTATTPSRSSTSTCTDRRADAYAVGIAVGMASPPALPRESASISRGQHEACRKPLPRPETTPRPDLSDRPRHGCHVSESSLVQTVALPRPSSGQRHGP
jgi:hypothetical protein